MGKRNRKLEGGRSRKRVSDHDRESNAGGDTSLNPEGNWESPEPRPSWNLERPGYRAGEHWITQGEYSGLGNFGPPYSPGWSRSFPPEERRQNAGRRDWRDDFRGGFGNSGSLSEAAYQRGHGERSGESRGSASRGYGRGPHAGRGPRGYERSDDRLYEEVCDRLTEHGGIDASRVEVRCAQGEVTLEGTVEDRYSKRLAEEIAESARGVRDVHNRLRVAPSTDASATRPSQSSEPEGPAHSW